MVAERIPFYADVSDVQWSDWRWQQRNRITRLDALERVLQLSDSERRGCLATENRFRLAITPYYLELMDPVDPECPIRRQAVPTIAEMEIVDGESPDPLAEEAHMPSPGLTHRYPDRALLYASHNCPVYCRFCTRKRKVSDPSSALGERLIKEALETIRKTPAIREVIISGGDPLSLSNAKIAGLLDALSAIPHVEIARIATRNLVTLPQRVDAELCDLLRQFQGRRLAVYMMTHFNHWKECTDEAWEACDAVVASGTPIQNQMVLLRGINDQLDVVEALNRRLLRMRVKPYYILHADMVSGISHFRTSIAAGRQLMSALRGHVSGLAVPQYVVDLPGGGGKVALLPDYLVESDSEGHHFRNYRGEPFFLPEKNELE